jgi:excisionase family DNA binding protein
MVPILPIPEEQPTVGIEVAAKALSISRTAAYAAVKRGEIPSIRIGHRILVPTAALRLMLGQSQRSAEKSTRIVKMSVDEAVARAPALTPEDAELVRQLLPPPPRPVIPPELRAKIVPILAREIARLRAAEIDTAPSAPTPPSHPESPVSYAPGMADITKWEYMTASLLLEGAREVGGQLVAAQHVGDLVDKLNRHGANGWEAVGQINVPMPTDGMPVYPYMLLKRPLSD